MQTQFNVPSFFHPEINSNEIQKIEQHLHALKLQKCVYDFLQVFEKMPALKSFSIDSSYESNDEGGTYLSLHSYGVTLLKENSEEDENDEQEEDCDESDEAYALNDFLYNVKEDECEYFFEELSGTEFTRENLIENVRQAMGEQEYDTWQSMVEKFQLEKTVAQTEKVSEVGKI